MGNKISFALRRVAQSFGNRYQSASPKVLPAVEHSWRWPAHRVAAVCSWALTCVQLHVSHVRVLCAPAGGLAGGTSWGQPAPQAHTDHLACGSSQCLQVVFHGLCLRHWEQGSPLKSGSHTGVWESGVLSLSAAFCVTKQRHLISKLSPQNGTVSSPLWSPMAAVWAEGPKGNETQSCTILSSSWHVQLYYKSIFLRAFQSLELTSTVYYCNAAIFR